MKINHTLALVFIALTLASGSFADTHKGKRPLFKAYLGNSQNAIAPLNAITQAQLRFLGYYSGKIDNNFGPNSKAALKRFQQGVGLNPSGVINRITVQTLEGRVERSIGKRLDKNLDGRWAKFGECKRRSIEVRGNILIKRHKGRLSVPRLDFFEFTGKTRLHMMISRERSDFSVGQKGLLKAKPVTAFLFPKEKPVEVDETLVEEEGDKLLKLRPKEKPSDLEFDAGAFERCK